FHQLEMRYESLRVSRPEWERRLISSLAECGQQSPIVVVEASEGEQRYVVVDGYKRVRGLKRLKQDTVRASLWTVGEAEALIQHRLMQSRESPSALEQGWLLRELNERFGMDPLELAQRFDRTPSWVSRRLSLVKQLPEEIQQRVRVGKLLAHAAMKYLVPLARANYEDCLRLVDGISSRRLTTRQIGRLYTAYVSGNETTRELVLQKPLVFLQAQEQARHPVELTSFEELQSDMNLLASVSRRVLRRIRGGVELVAEEQEQLRRGYLQAKADFEQLARRCDKEWTDA
ncbi:MAG: ParB/RepB/Spo0J family partition protein, partial [Vicinamibacteria bacterium]